MRLGPTVSVIQNLSDDPGEFGAGAPTCSGCRPRSVILATPGIKKVAAR